MNQILLFWGPRTDDSPAVGSHDRTGEALAVGGAGDATHHGGLAADERPNSMRARSHRRGLSFGICLHLICEHSVRHDVLLLMRGSPFLGYYFSHPLRSRCGCSEASELLFRKQASGIGTGDRE